MSIAFYTPAMSRKGSNAMSQDKRQSSRADVFLIADYRPVNKSGEYSTGITDNFSSEGLSFETQDVHLKTGDILDMKLKAPQNGMEISAVGEIAWRQDGWYKCTLGVKFKEIEEEAREKIFVYINDEKKSQDTSVVNEELSPPSTEQKEDTAPEVTEEKKEEQNGGNGVLESVLRVHGDRSQLDDRHEDKEEHIVFNAPSEEEIIVEDEEYDAPSVADRNGNERIPDNEREYRDLPQSAGKVEYASYLPRRRKRYARKSRRSLHITAALFALVITVPAVIYIFNIQRERFIPSSFEENTGRAEGTEQTTSAVEEPEDIALQEPISPLSPDSGLFEEKRQEAEKPVASLKAPEQQDAVESTRKLEIDHIIQRKSSRLETVTPKIATPGTIQPVAKKQSPPKKDPPVQRAGSVTNVPAEKIVKKPQTDLLQKEEASNRAGKEPKETVSKKISAVKALALSKQKLHTEQPRESLPPSENNLIADPAQTGQKEVLPAEPIEQEVITTKIEEPSVQPVTEVEKIKIWPEDVKTPTLTEDTPLPEQQDTEKVDQPVAKTDPPVDAGPALKIETGSKSQQPARSLPSIGLVIRSKKK
ncbi:MAG: PilZ domain-containing protein [Nitrospiraceae bacterium]|nr:MAG: PilZ domain-containing protein [Nitrospiraceae bacterium]